MTPQCSRQPRWAALFGESARLVHRGTMTPQISVGKRGYIIVTWSRYVRMHEMLHFIASISCIRPMRHTTVQRSGNTYEYLPSASVPCFSFPVFLKNGSLSVTNVGSELHDSSQASNVTGINGKLVNEAVQQIEGLLHDGLRSREPTKDPTHSKLCFGTNGGHSHFRRYQSDNKR